jgi:Protein of unknown function (DUF4199)
VIRLILIYGLISGLVIITAMIGVIALTGGEGHSVWLGYLIMLVALSAILVGVKQHRDQALGGVIRFVPALLVGVGIALVASLAYVAIWEVYDAATHRTYMTSYVAETLEARRAAGVSGAAYDKLVADMETLQRRYANPLFRLPMVFLEIFPVGVLVALVSAALLRNPRFLPARAPRSAAA